MIPAAPLFAFAGSLLAAAPDPAARPLERIDILAPAAAGGGFDLTARAIREALIAGGLVREVSIENSPGAGGVIGLAQFVHGRRGEDDALLVGGRMMLGAIRAARASVSLAQSTPLARLTGECEVVVAAQSSPVRDAAELVGRLRSTPEESALGGGPAGGADQLFVSELAAKVAVDASRLNYVAYSRDSDVVDALLAGRIAAGVFGCDTLGSDADSPRLRPLAVSSETRLPGTSIATLREQGIDFTFMNWRGVFAPPELGEEQKARLGDLIERMVRTDAWRSALARHRWVDLYLGGDAFVGFLLEEEERAARAHEVIARPDATSPATRAGWRSRNRIAVAVALLAALALVAGQRLTALRRERELYRKLEEMEGRYRERGAATQERLTGLRDQIRRQFEAWGLTAAEREVALLMLRGLRHKEIASLRGTSYGTVRQQALVIYKKSGLDGRTDLAVFFLEKLLGPRDSERRASA